MLIAEYILIAAAIALALLILFDTDPDPTTYARMPLLRRRLLDAVWLVLPVVIAVVLTSTYYPHL